MIKKLMITLLIIAMIFTASADAKKKIFYSEKDPGLAQLTQNDTEVVIITPTETIESQVSFVKPLDEKVKKGKAEKATISPGTYANYNDPTAYKLTSWVDEKAVTFNVPDLASLRAEGLTASAVAKQLAAAIKLWDDNIQKVLFNTPIVSSNGSVDKYDKINTVGFKPITGSALAYSRTWYVTSRKVVCADGIARYPVIESDLIFDSDLNWSATGMPVKGKYDFGTVATHEAGHTLGMGDTYLDLVLKFDLYQIMCFYDGFQNWLGAGDIAGLRKLYG